MTGAEFDGVDLDLLADYVGGALDGTPDQERVATLVSGDPAWRRAFEMLEPGMIAVEAALREFEPEPMPGDLAARLDAMFRVPEEIPGGADAVPAKIVDLDGVRRARARRWAAPIGVAAAVLAFAGFGVSQLSDVGVTNDSAESTAAGGAADQSAPLMASIPADNVIFSDTDYTAGTLVGTSAKRSQAGVLSDSSEPATAQASGFSPLARLIDPSGLISCLDAITRSNGDGQIAVELVDYARFDGEPAMIVRFSAANGVWVWAVGPECGAPGAGADTVEQLPVR
ncbi:hypothetical protein GCM10010112_74050 [Actinoplanes lobatus]|uniref:Uncharacterized protein n=1 Tax=Actinoplanes lobatus TaxID=113568 RepID=A0A7W7MF45_9ACTN|nr:hypothetical protein [Actinoplanes lobatus]MBB4747888.1 hypothetical protein [Actinoplanes lobatus]GGN89519.1 hypothetical protein GCM10010112_74050 [Actinoplanes lobatus]GIE43681.1 hypothetical protein Alo02nite_65790 [Actinoplanes lobatus]